MHGYTKLFSEIITSTIWQEPNDMRVLWITMLALKGRDHVVNATLPSLAKLANISNEDCEAFLARFQQPDKYSRSQEHEGRRIEQCAGGWFILNGEKYRDKLNADDRREQVRLAVERHRAKQPKVKRKIATKHNTQLRESGPTATTDEINAALRVCEEPPLVNGAGV